MRLAILAVLLIAGCREEQARLPWGPRRITQVDFGPFKVKIPAGWRDVSELTDAKMREIVPAGHRWLVRESYDGSRRIASIRFSSRARMGTISCAELEHSVTENRANTADVTPIAVGGYPGCKVKAGDHQHGERGVIAFVGEDRFQIVCVEDTVFDPAVDRACDEVLAQLGIDYTPPPREGEHLITDKIGEVAVKVRRTVMACRGTKGAKVILGVGTDPDGKPTVVVLETTDDKLAACAVAAMEAARFPATEGGRRFNETYEW